MTFPRSSAELIKNTSTISPTTLPTVKDALDNLAGRSPTAIPVPITEGGTGQTTANAAFNALAPTTTRGDIIYRNATVNARLGVGASNTILRSDGTDPAWATLASLGSPAPGLDADLLDGNHASAFALLSGASFTGNINISNDNPAITFTDTDTGADSEILAGSSFGALIIRADKNNEVSGSHIRFDVDGAEVARLTAGLQVGSPTGGDKGAGSGNFITLYENNNRVAVQALTNTFTVQQNITPPNAHFGLYIARSGQVAPHIRLEMTSSANTGDRFIDFQNDTTGTIGTITVNGASNVSYNTSSDPRMKKDLERLDLTESVERIKALKLWKGKWKADDAPFRGILTTELQHVIPEAVTGPEDGIEEEWVVGNEEEPRIVIRGPKEDGLKKIEAKAPKDADLHPLGERIAPQMWDASKCMPDVMGALQWTVNRIETLEARIAALEEARHGTA